MLKQASPTYYVTSFTRLPHWTIQHSYSIVSTSLGEGLIERSKVQSRYQVSSNSKYNFVGVLNVIETINMKATALLVQITLEYTWFVVNVKD